MKNERNCVKLRIMILYIFVQIKKCESDARKNHTDSILSRKILKILTVIFVLLSICFICENPCLIFRCGF